jgi:uncharacterized protein (TIGR03067 family)
MLTRLSVLVPLGIVLVSAGIVAGGDAKEELKKFQGVWAVESVREKGIDVPAEETQKMTVAFTGDKLTLGFEGKESKSGTFKVNPASKPKHINVRVKGKVTPGIYAFEGGKLKLCVTEGGGPRPTEFSSPVGSKTVLLVLKRVKK